MDISLEEAVVVSEVFRLARQIASDKAWDWGYSWTRGPLTDAVYRLRSILGVSSQLRVARLNDPKTDKACCCDHCYCRRQVVAAAKPSTVQ